MESSETEGDVGCPSSSNLWSVLPEQLKAVSVATELPKQRHRWNTNEEVASLLLAFDKHQQWIQKEVFIRPPSGTMLFYLKNLKSSQKYRKDGYFWKKRRDGTTTREDHMKLKVQGVECIYGCYVHSAILPTFHRRSYWLLQNPDVVLVHYLNVPLTEDTPLPALTIQRHKTKWTEDQLMAQLRPMFAQGNNADVQKANCMCEETIRSVAQRLLESQRRLDCHCSNVCKCNNCRACKQKRLPPQLVTYLSQRAATPNGEQQIATKVTPHGATYLPTTMPLGAAAGNLAANQTVNVGQPHLLHRGVESTSKLPPKSVLIKTGAKAPGSNKPLILNLSQLQGNNSLIILSSATKSSSPMTIIARKPPSSQGSQNLNIAQNSVQQPAHNSLNSGIMGNVNLTLNAQQQQQQQSTALISQGHIHNAINSQGHIQNAVNSQGGLTQGQIYHPGEHHQQQQPRLRAEVQGHSILQGQPFLNSQQNVLTSQGHSNNSSAISQVLSDSLLYTPASSISNGHSPTHTTPQFNATGSHMIATNEPRRHSEGDSNKMPTHHPHARPQRAFTISDPAEFNFLSSLLPTTNLKYNNYGIATTQTNNYGNSQPVGNNFGNIASQTGTYGNAVGQNCSNYGNAANQNTNYENSANQAVSYGISDHQSSHLLSNNINTPGSYGNTLMNNHAAQSQSSSSTQIAQAQMAESDMAVDFLIQELNMKNNTAANGNTSSFSDNLNNTHTSSAAFEDACSITGSHTSVMTNGGNIPMQISPSSPDINLDDFVDLSFLDSGFASSSSTETPIATSTASSATNVTMMTTSSPISSIGDYHVNKKQSCDHRHLVSGNITDFCPEWSFTKGGAKVLVTGPWSEETGSYAVLFDGVAVPATLVQKGVLRCYCPDHHPGDAMLEVACNGHVISDSVTFEYKTKQEEHTEETDWFNIEDYQLRTWLLERLQAIESCLSTEGAVGLSTRILTKPQRDIVENLELRVIECVQQLSQKSWPGGETPLPQLTTHTLSLVHLAAALGYARLIRALIGWKSEKSNPVLESEVDLLGLDINECTPLAWSCAHGHQDAVSTLYKYCPEALKVKNNDKHNAIDVARQHRHSSIASKLWGMEKARQKSRQNVPPVVLQPSEGKNKVVRNGDVNLSGSLLTSDKTDSCEIVDSQMFKVPASPLHSTPRAVTSHNTPNQSGSKTVGAPPKSAPPALLSIDIPQDNTLQVTPRSRKSHDSRRSRLLKRISVEVLPDYPGSDPAKGGKLDTIDLAELHQVRAKSLTLEEMADPKFVGNTAWGNELDSKVYNDPMFSMNGRDLNSPLMFMSMLESQSVGLTLQDIQQHTAMETESSCNTSCSSSLGDAGLEDIIDSVSTQDVSNEGNQGNQMATLANQIIAAIPERIKASPSRSEELVPDESLLRRDRSSSYSSFSSGSSTGDQPPCTEDSGISTPLDTPLEGIAFEDYRYVDLGTPASSHSPASSLHSPYVDHFSMDSPPPTTAEFNEYFNAPQTYMEKDFSQLTLSDTEQRKLYEAAKIIQNFFRRFKDRREQQMLQRQREMQAAILIQSYYRRYKQYLYYKKMTVAATLIQSQFRSYYAQKRFRQSREAATLIQNRYRAYKEQERYRKRKDAAVLIQQRFRNHYQRKRNQKGEKSSRHGDSAEGCSKTSTTKQASSSSSTPSEETDPTKNNSSNGKSSKDMTEKRPNS